MRMKLKATALKAEAAMTQAAMTAKRLAKNTIIIKCFGMGREEFQSKIADLMKAGKVKALIDKMEICKFTEDKMDQISVEISNTANALATLLKLRADL